ncbi:hypothetical protein [Streptococcus ovuberis]|uniref:Uncharacterized protein n=1 Tax=Streptococcus ovuberis TaxID=1936207 RepID=A0A7X6S1A5_9STRE|nr:hypothetical protein [Streptococcus ovuberis]NKZ19981.1 hypothetical protein [Streptococcus ovuberis]
MRRKILLVLFVILGAFWIYVKVFEEPRLAEKEKKYIARGLAKERDSYLMRQTHTYYFTNKLSMEDVLSHLDIPLLEAHLEGLSNKFVKALHVGVSDHKLYLQTHTVTAQMGFQAVFEQIATSTGIVFCVSVNQCKGFGLETFFRLPYNVFLTFIENTLVELDGTIEVERKLIN